MVTRSKRSLAAGCVAALGIIAAPVSGAAEQAQITTSPVYWSWDLTNPIGTSTLVRSSSGVTAVVDTGDMPAGQAVTLWIIVFNNPEACDSSPCTDVALQPDEFLGDLFNASVAGDFYFGGGHVTGRSGQAVFAGHLQVGATTGSGRVEVGISDAVPLMNPFGAEILLALHSHGPAMHGTDLRDQISSFLGGCAAFLGPNGFAAGPGDVPDAMGECSTMQFSIHTGHGAP